MFVALTVIDQHPMDDTDSYFGCDDQGIFMGVVHLICVCLCEDDVSQLLCCTLCKVYIYGVHHGLGWTPRFLGVSITRVAALPSLVRLLENGKDLLFG